MKKVGAMQEAQLYAFWQNLARSGQSVGTAAGPLRVLEAGQLNLHRGPDFISALFELNGTRISGDVEMHRHLHDWYAHQHHLDPFFKNVSLHVVLAPQLSGPQSVTSALSGRAIPTLQLDAGLFSPAQQQFRCSCWAPSAVPLPAIRRLALQRLHLKIRYFQHQLEHQPVEQVFYEHFFRILGYPHNAWPFQLLARRLPWAWLESHWSSFWPGAELLYALYAGSAAFLPAASDEAYVQRLIQGYQQYQALLPAPPLRPEHWQYSGLRPANHPHYRLAAWVALLSRQRVLPFYSLRQLFMARRPVKQLLNEARAFFHIVPQGYWRRHHRLASRPTAIQNQQFFGSGRISEILINLLIPLLAAEALLRQSDGFYDYLLEFYLSIPLQTVYKKIERFFPWLSVYRTAFPHQALMQALLHLHEQYCLANHCAHCPLGHTIDK